MSEGSSCDAEEDKAAFGGPQRTPVREAVGEGEGEAGSEGAEAERGERLRRAHAIATELLETERHYVAVLHLIDQVRGLL